MLHIVTVTHQETHDNVQSNIDDVIAGGSQGVHVVVQAERQHRERAIELHRSVTHEPKVEMAPGCKEDLSGGTGRTRSSVPLIGLPQTSCMNRSARGVSVWRSAFCVSRSGNHVAHARLED